MTRNPDMPCSECGKLMWRKGCLPEGRARCLECRAIFDPSKCGSPAGIDQHRRKGVETCSPCRQAWNDYLRRRLVEGKRPPSKKRTTTPKPCDVCGDLVTGRVRSDRPMHNDCRPPMHWTNAIQISRRERFEIYERDGWTCQICMGRVDSDLDPQHRMAATLDHIIPRATTLFPDDRPENLRLAHRGCNSRRGLRAA